MLAAASTSQEDVAVSSVNLVYNEINFLCSEVIVKNHFLLHVIMDPYFNPVLIHVLCKKRKYEESRHFDRNPAEY